VLQPTVSEGLAQGPYMLDRVGFEPATFRMEGPKPYHAQLIQMDYVVVVAAAAAVVDDDDDDDVDDDDDGDVMLYGYLYSVSLTGGYSEALSG